MKNYTHNQKPGKFCSPNPEPLARKAVSAKLPVSVDTAVHGLAGDDLSKWIRQAIAEKLARVSQ